MIDIISAVKAQHWPTDQYTVFGSGILGALGIRNINDIDIAAIPALYEQIKSSGWVEKRKRGFRYLIHGPFEVYDTWEFENYSRTPEELIETSVYIDGVPFVRLEEVIRLKQTLGRPKDTADIELIEHYLAHKK